MGGVALLAKQMGFHVTGSDQNVYPPMSTQLEEAGIRLMSGFSETNLLPVPDLVVVGNALSRGNPEVEAVLNQRLRYVSGPQWLGENLLKDRWVLAVAGTHGKTTCSSMLAWLLEYAGQSPGFLIGGIPFNFGLSARLGDSKYFVVEADEYDTAFFDKRSKFVHYHPVTTILNNLEFDHADIFPDLDAIKKQFHHLVRTIPGNGLVIMPDDEPNLENVIDMGCWTDIQRTRINTGNSRTSDWNVQLIQEDASVFDVYHNSDGVGRVEWDLTGHHNAYNAIAAIAAARHAGIPAEQSVVALGQFKNVKRRMEIRAVVNQITIYDDFAHHPTAIQTTLQGLRARVKTGRILAIVEPRSNTMRLGYHADTLPDALSDADIAIVFHSEDFPDSPVAASESEIICMESVDAIVRYLKQESRPGDHLVFMSNGSFGGIYDLVETALKES